MTADSARLDEIVAGYLRQTRLAGSRPPTPELVELYHANFDDILRRLGIADMEGRPHLHVTYSTAALVETLAIGNARVIVYDQYLGQAFNRLTEFAVAEWPANLVLKWGFKQLAIAFAGLGRFVDAGAAVDLCRMWPDEGRPVGRSASLRHARALLVGIQEYFVMAHECAHVALMLHGERLDEYVTMIDELVEAVVEAQRERTLATDQAEVARLNRRILDEAVRAILRGSRSADSAEPPPGEALEVPAAWAEQDPERLATWLAERGHLREEILCDVIATEMTMARFGDLRMGPSVVIPNLLHALHNLTSLEVIRANARARADAEHDAQTIETLARKVVWRTLAELEYGPQVEPAGWLDRQLTKVTELHAATVGDVLLYSLMAEFDGVINRLGDALPPESEVREAVLEILPTLKTATVGADPEDARPRSRLGVVPPPDDASVIDDPEEMARSADEAGDPEGSYVLGLLLIEQGDLEGAEAALGRAAEHGHAAALDELGAVLSGRGDLDGAETAWRAAADKDEVRAMNSLGLLLEQHRGDLEAAEAMFRRADEQGHAVAACNLGVLLRRRGDLVGAEAALQRSVKRGYLGALNPLGHVLADLGHLDDAERAWRRGDAHGDAAAAVSVAAMLQVRGDVAGAEAAVRRARDRGLDLPGELDEPS